MLLINIMQLALAISVSCFTVPEGLPAGVYSVLTMENGTEIHTLLELNPGLVTDQDNVDVNTRGLVPSAKFKPRQVPGYYNTVGCGGYFLNVVNTNNANAALDRQCGNGATVGGGLDFYSISGCTVAYFCNMSEELRDVFWFWTETKCYASERQSVATIINQKCGNFGAGWDNIASPDGLSRVGQYGWENICDQGKNFCGRSV